MSFNKSFLINYKIIRLSRIRELVEYFSPRPVTSIAYFLVSALIFFKNILIKNFSYQSRASKTQSIAYLIATGPSIKNVDLSKLIGSDVYTVSNFVLHDLCFDLNPCAHFIAAFHPPLDMDSIDEWLRVIDAKLPVGVEIVTDDKNKYFISGRHFIGRKVIYIETFPMLDLLFICPPYITPRPWSVPQLAIPYIFSLGYSEIVLCGCDHTALASYGEIIKHFYEPDLDVRTGASDILAWQDGGIIKQLRNNLELFRLYRNMQKYYSKRGKSISRISADGWLDFIPKK